MQVSLLGWGSLGRTVGRALAAGEVPGAELHTVAELRASTGPGEPGAGASGADGGADGGVALDCPAPLVSEQ